MRLPRIQLTFRRLLLIGALAFLALLCSTAGPFRSVEGQGVTAQEANARLWNCFVPDDATDVWYTSSYSFTRVECTIEPESFRLWCERQGWRLEPIVEGKPWAAYPFRGDPILLESGFHFNDRKGKHILGCSGRYDSRNKRAYVNYTSR